MGAGHGGSASPCFGHTPACLLAHIALLWEPTQSFFAKQLPAFPGPCREGRGPVITRSLKAATFQGLPHHHSPPRPHPRLPRPPLRCLRPPRCRRSCKRRFSAQMLPRFLYSPLWRRLCFSRLAFNPGGGRGGISATSLHNNSPILPVREQVSESHTWKVGQWGEFQTPLRSVALPMGNVSGFPLALLKTWDI